MDVTTDSQSPALTSQAMNDHRGALPETLLITLTGKDRQQYENGTSK